MLLWPGILLNVLALFNEYGALYRINLKRYQFLPLKSILRILLGSKDNGDFSGKDI